MALWFTETFDDEIRFGLKVKETLFAEQSKYQRVELFDTEAMGRTLAIDGIYMTSEVDEYLYHEMIVHPALCTAPSVKNVLVIGGGDGGTAREALRHPEVESVTLCEIDEAVIRASKEHLPKMGAWDDPRLTVKVGDGIEHIKQSAPNTYDIILLDGSDPVGPAEGLFDKSFYQAVEKAIKPDGVFALQSEGPVITRDLFINIVDTLKSMFKEVHPFFGSVPIYGGGPWSWTYCSQNTRPFEPIESRIKKAEETSKYYNGDIHRGAFALPQAFKKRWAK